MAPLPRAGSDPQSVQALVMKNTGRKPGDHDTPAAHAAVLPSQGGLASARGLAGPIRFFEQASSAWKMAS